MAKILGKDPATYPKERDGFLRDLQHFHDTRGTPFRRPPKIGGHEIDLYLLYTLVTAQGGWIKVNSRNGWPNLFDQFGVPTKCVNASVALKQIYLRYLDRWEKVHFLGEEADRGSDDDEESRHRRWSARALHSVPCVYNYQQHNIADSIRDYNHLSTELHKPSDYDRLALSLISPLPNEQDFAINVCTLLSNDGKHTLKLERYPKLLDHLLAHAGVFNHTSLRKLFVHCYSNIRKHSIHSFWRDVLEDFPEFLDLTDENKFIAEKEAKVDEAAALASSLLKDDTEPTVSTADVPMDTSGSELLLEKLEEPDLVSDSASDCELFVDDDSVIDNIPKGKGFKLKHGSDSIDRELFCLGRTLGTQDYIGQRVLQIATILRNLSFIEDNLSVLNKNQTFVRFVLLCAGSRWAHLKNLGLDMLGNVATDYLVKDLPSDRLAVVLLKIVTKCLNSEDRTSCISSLEVLNKLSQNEANEEVLLRLLQSSVYQKVCSFLTLHDVMLLIYTLECLYSLSSLGERACNLIVNNHGVVDTLVSLVTVEGKSYGPKACIGMKLVETVPGGSSAQNSQNATSTTATSTSTAVSSSSSTTVSTATVMSSAPTLITTSTTKPLSQTTPSRPVAIAPQRLIAITPVSSTTTTSTVQTSQVAQVITSQQLVQQQHAHQQAIQENEQFALSWLRATYEPCANGRIDHQELYKHYINSCAKIGRRGVIAPLHFPRCVRSVFGGTVGPNPVKPANSTDPQYYDGIKVRAQPLVINTQPTTTPTPLSPVKTVRRKGQSLTQASTPSPPTLTVVADNSETPPASPASPILKAQLSAPPKQREVTVNVAAGKGDVKSQVMAHPHLSQALLGNNNNTAGSSKDAQAGQSNTSLIKSLLATKVNNDCMTTVSMRTAADCQNVTQVAARQQQQRLLAQQTVQTPDANKLSSIKMTETPKSSRLNGARQLFTESDIGDSAVSSTTTNSIKSTIREPPQPPPPLAPLSNTNRTKTPRIDNEDSDSTGNNSLASSSGLGTIGIGGISSTEDGDNSLTSFEGLLNGVPNIDNPLNEDSNSKDSLKNSATNILSKNKPLMLADLLEKKVDKDPPLMLNGVLGKELRIGDKGLELVENHIEKVLKKEVVDNNEMVCNVKVEDEVDADIKVSLKRPASDDIVESDAKKMHLSSNNVNGSVNSPAPESVSSSNGDEGSGTVSTAAAKLFADIAADILEDEEEELMQQENQIANQQPEMPQTNIPQIIVDSNQQVLLTQPRQIIVSQPQMQSVIPGQLKTTQSGQTVIVQSSAQQRTPVLLQQSNTGQILLSQGLQGQVQLVASTTQPGQYVLQTGGAQGAYVVAQPQTAVVHGQPQTVLVAQTAQQQGTPAKTIIILQQQPASNSATHHQKVVVTPQGQQVVVTQVQRPILQTSTVSNNVVQTTTITKTTAATVITQSNATNTVSVAEKKDDVKPQPPKPKIIRDLTSPFVCEWGDCPIEAPFKTANEVYLHVCEMHCPQGSEEIVCQWDRCDNLKRKRFSLMTHLHDKHCNTEAMKASLTRRKQLSQSGKVEVTTPAPVTPHPGYAPDAAFHAIKRHALEFVNPKELQRPTKQGTATVTAPAPRAGPPATEQDDNEGPVTKSIRLTASLILRNLVIYSSNCRRYLKHYEPHLANVALSNVESSRTIAQILYDMNEGTNHR